MNKTEFIAAVAEKAELSKKQAEAAYDAMLETVQAALKNGEKVQLLEVMNLKKNQQEKYSTHSQRKNKFLQLAKFQLSSSEKHLKKCFN